MQSIAAENNLSETAFRRAGSRRLPAALVHPHRGGGPLRPRHPWPPASCSPDAATPAPFRYLHPLRRADRVRVRRRGRSWTSPPTPFARVATPDGLAAALGAEPLEVVQSARLVAVLASPAQVAALRPDLAAVAARFDGAVAVTAAGGADGADITSRYFAPGYGIDEDPVTGSLHTQVVPYWADKLGKTTLVCHQASARRRDDDVQAGRRAGASAWFGSALCEWGDAPAGLGERSAAGDKASGLFLKKRTKKLLSPWDARC